jgi:hypothetical protein
MKRITGFILSWLLWVIGDLIGRPMVSFDWAWLYPAYNWLMLTSSDLHAWGGIGPWREVE